MNTDERHVYGPRPVAALLPRITRPVFRRRTAAAAQVLTDWPEIVGPALAAVSVPRRLSHRTLTIACTGPVAMELQHYAPEVMARINAHLGSPTVAVLRFVQTVDVAPILAAPPAEPAQDIPVWVDAVLDDMPEGGLRLALAALGQAVAGQSRAGTAKR